MFRKNDLLKGLSVLALLSLALVVFAACAPAAAPPAAPPVAAQPTAVPVEPTAAPAEPTTAPAQPTAATAAEYKAEIRPATKRWKIGYGDGLAGIPFTDSVTKSINDVAAKMGVDIVYCDNAYNQEKTVECSNSLVTQQADGVIFANWIAGTEEMVANIFHEANIPCVTYDGPHPGCVAFGPDNFEAAKEAGKFLGEYAKAQGWDPNETQLVLVWSPDVPVHKARADGAKAGLESVFAIPAANIHDVGTKAFDDVLPNVTTWATAHPDAKNVLCFGHSDQPGVDCALALEKAGFQGRAAAASLGASDEALVDLRTRTDDESIFKATISYFPERYGEYLVPIIVDL
ncbi:MAG: substrate-binding domain-containing protein, partial [Anaerolineae bacterium]|nr:substrate-binding domain-containing protein [Anaerolineae bacterium]